jgi:hypothetical protein
MPGRAAKGLSTTALALLLCYEPCTQARVVQKKMDPCALEAPEGEVGIGPVQFSNGRLI